MSPYKIPKSCRGCIYRRRLSSYENNTGCLYMHDTGSPRGCPVDKCDKKVVAEKKQKKNKGE